VPLTDPELDLLRELLDDDPTDDVYLQVGEELVRRAAWVEAERVLTRGLEANDDEEGWALLARAALETSDFGTALKSWARAGSDQQGTVEMMHVHALALERSGRMDEARHAVDRYLQHHPGDVVLESIRERLDAPPPDAQRSANDPFLTVQRAEQYAAIGRLDRAARIYRRILFRYPDDLAIRARLLQIDNAEDDDLPQDLSEELLDPNLVPPDLTMPQPGITSASVEPAPQRNQGPQNSNQPSGLAQFVNSAREAERRVRRQEANSLPPPDDTEEVEELPGLSDMGMPTRRRRKRRSLLKR
jgi:tetratricopeptide (TPR) repeat protein